MILELNLQFFADEGPGGEKTEEPTGKKISDTRKEGKVAKSKELSNAVQLISLFIILRFWIGTMGNDFMTMFDEIYEKIPAYTTFWSGNIVREDYRVLFNNVYLEILFQLLPFFVVGVALSIIINMLQFKFKITTKPLKPKFSKFNPISGFKRIFSMSKIVELLKSVAMIIIISTVVYTTIKDEWVFLYKFYEIFITHIPLPRSTLWSDDNSTTHKGKEKPTNKAETNPKSLLSTF